MKFLLTSAGVTNASIKDALVALLGKPINEASALFIPTAIYPFSSGSHMAFRAITGTAGNPFCELGWKSLGVLELTALPTIRKENWVPLVEATDALLVWGGDVLYLTHWMRHSGFADLLPRLEKTVYVGMSAGSIAVTPYNCDAEWDLQFVPEGCDMNIGAETALGLVDFALYPHLDNPDMPDATLENIGKWAEEIPVRTYALDDQSAISVVDGHREVVSEGNWHRFDAAGSAPLQQLSEGNFSQPASGMLKSLPADIARATEVIAAKSGRSVQVVVERALRLYLAGEGAEILATLEGLEQLRSGESEDMDDVIEQIEKIIR